MKKALFLLCCAVLAYGLFRPQPPPYLFEDSDKFLHLIAFGGLALLSRLAFPRAPGWLLWGLLFVQAPLLEYIQHALQVSREFSYKDIFANLCGVSAALLAWSTSDAVRRLLA